MKEKIFLCTPHMGGDEIKFINEAFATNWIAPLGKNVTEFENEVCTYIGSKYSVALSSGTAAIHLALKYLGVTKGDIVFCSSFTFAASCNPIAYLGAIPVFIDSEPESWNMSYKALEKAYKKYPKPKAIIIVNLYGNPANYKQLLEITKKHNTYVIEDAAESFGSKYDGIQTGNFGDIGVFSFNGNKIITTSGGGMAILNDKKAKDKLLFWSAQSRETATWYQHNEIGYNYRLSNICAGIGRGQLEIIDERIKKKTSIYNKYVDGFKNIECIKMIPVPENCEPNHWLSAITLDKCSVNFTDIFNILLCNNIESRPVWKPMHLQPVFKNCDFFNHNDSGISICENIFNQGLCIPSDTKMTDEQQNTIINIINDSIK
jgi:dTDP-4-amino-4,6-dideoxygalactose transaminase